MVHRSPLAAERIAFVLALGLVVGCVGPLHPSLERRELAADPAASLRMSGADELAHFQRERENTVEGPAFAFDRYLFGTQSTFDEVVAFYNAELGRLGWLHDPTAASIATTDFDGRGWCKPKMVFRLAHNQPNRHVGPIAEKARNYRTVFDAGLIARDPQVRCPFQ